MSARARYGGLGLVLFLGAAIRLAFLSEWPQRLNPDEATVGLMGLQILRGEFPVFFRGQAYMGALEAYLTALVYTLVGASPLTLRVAPFLFSWLLVFVTFLIGQRMAGWPGGLAVALLAALAPPFLPLFGSLPMLAYIEVVVVGSLVLLLTLQLVIDGAEGSRRTRALLALGLMGGLGWWTNPMIVSYLAAAGLFLLLGFRRGSSRGLWAAPLGAVLGSLPAWLFDLTHAFRTFAPMTRAAEGDLPENLGKLPSLLMEIAGVSGFQLRGVFTDAVPFLSSAAGVIYLVLLGCLLGELIRRSPSEEPERRGRRRGLQLLVLFSVFHLLAFSLNGLARGATQRYLFPLYSSLPILTGMALLGVRRSARPLAAGALAVLLLNNVLGTRTTLQAFEAGRAKDTWKPEAVVALLQAEGLTRAYANAWIGYRLTFETRERLVAADPTLRRYPPHLEWVDTSPRVAYIASDEYWPTRAWLESSLRGIGASYRRRDFGELSVLYDFAAPAGGPLVSLPPTGWRAEGRPPGSDPALAFDRDVDTAWLSEEFLRPGMSYQLDLGRTVPVGAVSVLPVRPRVGVPKGYRIELSRDGATWETVASAPQFEVTLRWRDGQPRMEWGGIVVSRFALQPVRYVRITQSGQNRAEWWTIAEIFVYGPAVESPANGRAGSPDLVEGIRLEERGQLGPALAAYDRAIRVDPESEEAHWRSAQLYRKAGLPLPGSDPDGRGLVFERLGLWARAAREYEGLLVRDTSEDGQGSHVLERLREVYGRQGHLESAARVERRLRAEFTPPTPAAARFDPSIRLLGYGLGAGEPRPGDEVEVAYYWQALRAPAEEPSVFVHFVRDGKIRFSQDHELLHGRYPRSRWREGELIRERYRIRFPSDLPAGEYEIRVGVWNPRTGKRLSVRETTLSRIGDQVRLATVRLLAPR